ncbi:hypothetical protein V6N13_042679 [Hibiscus sabdariffa]
MVETLEELAELIVKNCDSLEEIIRPQGLVTHESRAETVTIKFAFPELACLVLDKLPRLRRFYSRMHTTEWPSLKRMEVIECPEVEIFAPQCPCFGETPTGTISNQQALFYVNEEELTEKQDDMVKGICDGDDMGKGICDGQLPSECFREVKDLNIQCFPWTSAALPYAFIDSLPNLNKLVINDASISQIVLDQMKTLEPSWLSFQNLTTLEVSRCHRLTNLMACSTATSLTLLEKLSISDCETMEEIIACESEEVHGDIVFPQLKYLQLSCLPSLATFSLMHHAFEFPVLLRVIVTKCPKMRNFCRGDLSTPKLQQMHLTRDDEDELWWDGDLNTTIEHMLDKMACQQNVQNSDVTEVSHQLPKLE